MTAADNSRCPWLRICFSILKHYLTLILLYSTKVNSCCEGCKAKELLAEEERTNRKLTCFVKEEGILILLHVLRRSGLIQEQRVNPFDVLHLDFCPLEEPKHTDDINTVFNTRVLAEITPVAQTELTLRLRHTSPAVLISWMA